MGTSNPRRDTHQDQQREAMMSRDIQNIDALIKTGAPLTQDITQQYIDDMSEYMAIRIEQCPSDTQLRDMFRQWNEQIGKYQRWYSTQHAVIVTSTQEAAQPQKVAPTEVPYPAFQEAFAAALQNATTFPFKVQYSDGGKSYEVQVSTAGNTIHVGNRQYIFEGFPIPITAVTLDNRRLTINGSHPIDKNTFITQYLPQILGATSGSIVDVGSGLTSGKVRIVGDINPVTIDTPTVNIDQTQVKLMERIAEEIKKNINTAITGIDVAQDLEFISKNVPDPTTRQMAINMLLSNLQSQNYTLEILRDGETNRDMVSVGPQGETATGIENALNSAINSGTALTLQQVRTSLMLGSGSKWSDYVRTLNPGDTTSPSPAGYAKFLADPYGIDLTLHGARQKVEASSMSPREKTYVLTFLNGQYNTGFDMGSTIQTYNQFVRDYTALQHNPALAPLLIKLNGGTMPSKAAIDAGAAAAARGSTDTGDGKPMTWMLGILGAIVGLGFKKGEGWSLWTSLSRIFKVGLGVGALWLGCQAAGEWKKELGDKDLCEEAKKALKEGLDEAGAALKSGAAAAGVAVVPAAAAAPSSGPSSGPASTLNVSKLSTSQRKAYDTLKKETTFINRVKQQAEANKKNKATEIGNFDDYMAFIFSNHLQSLTLDKLVYNKFEQSIFSGTGQVDVATKIPPELNNSTFKSIMRLYLTGIEPLELDPKPIGTKNFQDFSKKYPKDTYSIKTLSDITTEIHK